MVLIERRNLSQMTLISFVDGIRARPRVSFHNCAAEERWCDTIDSDNGLYGIQ